MLRRQKGAGVDPRGATNDAPSVHAVVFVVVVDVDKNNDTLWPVTHRIFAYRFRICARLNGPDGQHAVLVLCLRAHPIKLYN